MTTLETMYAPQVNSPATTLSANISSSATSISVLSGSVLPAAPNLLVIGGDTDSAETVRMTAKSGNTLTVVRGVQGTAKSWTTGATIARLFTAKDLSDVQGNITALNSGKAEAADLAAAEQRIDDVYAATASGPIASYYRTVGGLPVDDLTIDINPVQAGTGDPSPTNVRAISGWTGANVYRQAQNIWDEQTAQGYWNTDGTWNANTTGYISNATLIPVKPSVQYCITIGQETSFYLAFYDKDQTFISRTLYSYTPLSNRQFTTPANCYYLGFSTAKAYGGTYLNDISINYPATDTDYHPYSGSTTAISWQTEAGTVYGGTLDVTTGVLTVAPYTYTTIANVHLGYATWEYNSTYNFFRVNADLVEHGTAGTMPDMWCSVYKVRPYGSNSSYSSEDNVIFAHSSGGALIVRDSRYTDVTSWLNAVGSQVVLYPTRGGSATTYQLTPTQVTSLLGENNVWADTGDVYVTFGADIKSYIDETVDGKQDEITASGLLKGNGSGGVSAAVAGTDYQAPLTAGTDYQTPLAEEKLQYYGVCSTSASTQAKTVTIDGITALTTGLEIRVKMTNAQTYNGTPTLNVNSLGAKSIMQHGSVAAVRYQWQAGEVVSLTYDGTYWVLENNSLATTTYFGLTRLSSATNSTAEDSAATPKAVKTAYDLANAAVPATEKGTSVATLAVVGDSTTPTVPRLTPAQGFAPIFEIDSDTTLSAKHAGGILVCTNSPTITIPVSVFAAATEIEILNYGTGIVTVAGASGVSLNGASAGSKQIKDQYTSGVLLAISASQWVIQGAIE